MKQIKTLINYSQEHNLFYLYPEHFALFASFAGMILFTAKNAKDAKIGRIVWFFTIKEIMK